MINKFILIALFLTITTPNNATTCCVSCDPTFLGTNDFPKTIDQPGVYKLCADIQSTTTILTITTSHVTFDMNNYAFYNSPLSGIVINDGLHNIVIGNGTITDFSISGINIGSNCYAVEIKNMNLINGTLALTIGSSSHDIIIENSLMSLNANSAHTILLNSCQDIDFLHCAINNNTRDNGSLNVISCDTCNKIRFTNCSCNNNSITYASATTLNCLYCVDSTSCTISKCRFDSNTLRLGNLRVIYLFGQTTAAAGNIISESVLKNNMLTGGISSTTETLVGIDIENRTGNKINNCTINNNTSENDNSNETCSVYGIRITNADSQANIITNCLLSHNTLPLTAASTTAICYGIFLDNGMYHTVENCICLAHTAAATSSSQAAGIYVNSASQSIIKNCKTYGNTDYGIYNNGQDISVVNNTSAYNGTNGAGNYSGTVGSVPNSARIVKLGDNAQIKEIWGNADVSA